MLFNTLAYAKFFALVFAASWLLVRRGGALWLPWILLAATTLEVCVFDGAAATTWSVGWQLLPALATALAFFATRRLQRPSDLDAAPSWSRALQSCAINFLPLCAMLFVFQRTDLLTYSFGSALGVPSWQGGRVAWIALLDLAALVAGAALLRVGRLRLWLLLIASYIFYSRWDYRFLALIFASSSIDYWLGHRIARSQDPVLRKRWLLVTVAINLGVLAAFKYLNFGIESANALLRACGYQGSLTFLEVALPVGISFFTFESMSYVIDVYRRELEAHDSYLEYLTFVAFFPHLVAGPIVRPRDLLPQLHATPRFSERDASQCLYQIACGLMKKVVIGDYLAVNFVDRVFDAPANYSSLECYAAVVGYALQIYCDFSGYTDIAIGSAGLLGIRFPANFNAPYTAVDVQDFWRRWHISLSTWLRDYLYISLGGNRRGPVRTRINLLLTMLLGGLWHGANWTFVVWGALHGVALIVNRALPTPARLGAWSRAWRQFATFHFICITWIFFRSPSFSRAGEIFRQLAQGTTYAVHLAAPVLLALGVGLVSHFWPQRWHGVATSRFAALPAWGQAVLLLGVAGLVRTVASAEAVPFVYFQF